MTASAPATLRVRRPTHREQARLQLHLQPLHLPARSRAPNPYDNDVGTYPEHKPHLPPLASELDEALIAMLAQTEARPRVERLVIEMEEVGEGNDLVVCVVLDSEGLPAGERQVLAQQGLCMTVVAYGEASIAGNGSEPYEPDPEGRGESDADRVDDPNEGGIYLPDVPSAPSRIDRERSTAAAKVLEPAARKLPAVPELPSRADQLATRLQRAAAAPAAQRVEARWTPWLYSDGDAAGVGHA